VIGSGATLEGDFGSTGRFEEVEILSLPTILSCINIPSLDVANHIDYEAWNRLHNADITVSVILYASLPDVVNILAKATRAVPFSIGKARGRKDWIV
jgi:hypothetical protein